MLRWQSAARSGRKTDATDAHSVAVVALRTRSLRQVRRDDRTVALRLLADHRDERVGPHGGAFWRQEFPSMVAWAFGP